MVRKDVPAKLIIEILLAMVQSIMNPAKMEELGMMRRRLHRILKIVLEGALTSRAESVNASFVRENRPRRKDSPWRTTRKIGLAKTFGVDARSGALMLVLLLMVARSWQGGLRTIEVDESARGTAFWWTRGKIFKWEGDRLHEGQVIVQLDASELRARRESCRRANRYGNP